MNVDMWNLLSTWQFAACLFFTVSAVVCGWLYTHFMRSASVTKTASQAQSVADVTMENKWPVADTSSTTAPVDANDPVEYCTHIQSQIKQTKQRLAREKLMVNMSHQEKQAEYEIQRRQLEEIFRLMEQNKDTFGVEDVGDVQEQLKLYVQ